MQSSLAQKITYARPKSACQSRSVGSVRTVSRVHTGKATSAVLGSRSAVQSLQAKRCNTTTIFSRQNALAVTAGDLPPTVSDTKLKFITAYPKPIPAIFNTVLQELLCSQHLARYHCNYKYSSVMALGFVSVYDQIFSEYQYGDPELIFKAFIDALDESPDTYRTDSKALAELASSATSVDALCDTEVIKSLGSGGKILHNRFTAIGIFRMLELAGITEPAALEQLVTAAGMDKTLVSRDLLTYKGLLSKMAATKELMAETIARERKLTEERMKEKEAKAKKETNV